MTDRSGVCSPLRFLNSIQMIKQLSIFLFCTALLFIAGISSCKKLDHNTGFETFSEVFFDKTTSVTENHLAAKYNGFPIDWDVSGKIKVPAGEREFEFYDTRSGKVLGKKSVNIVAGKPENYLIFQPSEDSPLAFLDPNEQAGEAAAPEGFMKIKIANYAKDLLPFDKIDIVVLGVTDNFEFIEVATIASVGSNLENESYHLIPTDNRFSGGYTFWFKEHGSQSPVKDFGGTNNYANQGYFFSPESTVPYPNKKIFTIYFTAMEAPYEYEGFLKKDDKFYDINPNVLFSN